MIRHSLASGTERWMTSPLTRCNTCCCPAFCGRLDGPRTRNYAEGAPQRTRPCRLRWSSCRPVSRMPSSVRTRTSFRNVGNHYSSCTGVMALVAGGVLTVAHLGDSHAVVGFVEEGDWHAAALTVAHKPNTPSERQRIEDSGGVVQCVDDRRGTLVRAFLCGGDFGERKARGDNPRQLAYSRAFGGKDLKPYGLSNQPDIRQVVLNEKHKVLIMASDGLWDVCSEDKAVYLAMDAAERDLDAAQVLVEFALTENRINRTKADNITVIAVFFK
mmetsp:Transcript_31731/g.74274  ORF Transcript_31731/g.74274 Transcript_31731/m.74274 type:complete len:272 (+) Transcript_31731:198-1013(+)